MPVTLLLADDSVVIQKLVGLSFANEDIKIITVDNGDDAISRANECKPDIVLADVVMPGKNGYEVCSAIRTNPELAGTPVLLLTGTFEAFDEGRANEVGATGHVTKPFEAQVLVDRVTEILEQSRGAAQASPSLAGAGDFFDERQGEMGGTASTIPRPAQPSIGESFAFGTSMTNDSLNMGIDMANEPLSSPIDEVGAETAALVAGTDYFCSDSLPGGLTSVEPGNSVLILMLSVRAMG